VHSVPENPSVVVSGRFEIAASSSHLDPSATVQAPTVVSHAHCDETPSEGQ
jgi:hypothetical protein